MALFANKCQRIKRLLSRRLDEKLPLSLEKKVARHLEQCADCRAEEAFYSQIKITAANTDKYPMPDYLWERISLEVEEHPWGEDDEKYSKSQFSCFNLTKNPLNFSAIIAVLILALVLFPGTSREDGGHTNNSSVRAEENNSDKAYLSLYLINHPENFPVETHDFYINQLDAINQKTDMIKYVLKKFPNNRQMRLKLANIYSKKIRLYQQLGLSREFMEQRSDSLARFYDLRGVNRYE